MKKLSLAAMLSIPLAINFSCAQPQYPSEKEEDIPIPSKIINKWEYRDPENRYSLVLPVGWFEKKTGSKNDIKLFGPLEEIRVNPNDPSRMIILEIPIIAIENATNLNSKNFSRIEKAVELSTKQSPLSQLDYHLVYSYTSERWLFNKERKYFEAMYKAKLVKGHPFNPLNKDIDITTRFIAIDNFDNGHIITCTSKTPQEDAELAKVINSFKIHH